MQTLLYKIFSDQCKVTMKITVQINIEIDLNIGGSLGFIPSTASLFKSITR